MIVEDERGLNLEFFYDNICSRVKPSANPDYINVFLETYQKIEDKATHTQLRNDLIEHQVAVVWDLDSHFIHLI